VSRNLPKRRRIVPKKDWDKGGVSEIIGNLLILAITVTLFTSVLYFVYALPTPNEEVYTDFSSNLTVYDNNTALITIKHEGGQTLEEYRTGIYLIVDGTSYALKVSSGGRGEKWTAGQVWTYLFNETGQPIYPSTQIRMMIVDIVANTMIWDSSLNGQQGEFPPIIKERGILETPAYDGDSIHFYAKVVDPDGDLDSSLVYLDASSIGLSNNISLSDSNGDGIFVSTNFTARSSWNNDVVTFYAWDLGGHKAIGRTTLSVLPSGNGGGGNGGNGGGPGNLNYSGLQGFAFFEYVDWLENGYNANATTIFHKGERIVCVVSSIFLVNTQTENIFLVMDPETKVIIDSQSSPVNGFESWEFVLGYYMYTAEIDSGVLEGDNKYLVQIYLRDNWVPNNIFYATEMLTIWEEEDPDSVLPSFRTYADVNCTTSKAYFSTKDLVYVEIKMKYPESGTWDRWAGDVELRDFFWNIQLKRTPAEGKVGTQPSAWNGPVSNVWKINDLSKGWVYRFAINLANATYQEPYIPGNNSYVLRYDMFSAGNESYSLSRLIYVDAPKFKMDIVASVYPGSPSAWSAKDNIKYYRNDNQWNPPEVIEGLPEGNDKPASTLVRIGDINLDGKSDVVGIVKIPYNQETAKEYKIYVYLTVPSGEWTRKLITTTTSVPTALELGNMDKDSDLDVVVGYHDGDVYFYRNDGLWTPVPVDLTNPARVTSMRVGDLDTYSPEGAQRSLDIVIGRDSGGLTAYKNLNGIGTSWTRLDFTGGTLSYQKDTADGEILIQGSVVGDYKNTTSQNGMFEKITETTGTIKQYSIPTHEDPSTDAGDSIGHLAINDGEDYTVGKDRLLYIDGWDPSGIVEVDILSLKFKVRYQTDYNGADWIYWGNESEGPIHPAINIQKSSVYVDAEFDLTDLVNLSDYNNITSLNFRFENNGNRAVVFEYWALEVELESGSYFLEQVWTFDSVPEGAHQLNVLGNRSDYGGDNYVFYYSYDNITYNQLLTVTATVPSMYTALLGGTTEGTIYIKAQDSDRSSDLTPQTLWVDYLMINTTVVTGGAIGSILGVSIEDMNSVGRNEIVMLDDYGKIYWGYVNALGNALIMMNIPTANEGIFANAIGLATGPFVGGDTLKDIAVSTSTNTYIIQQTSIDVYDYNPRVVSVAAGTDYIIMHGGDVNGDGRTDVLLATENMILLFINTGDTFSLWERFVVDVVETSITDVSIGRTITY
jgi:hypothetical protein